MTATNGEWDTSEAKQCKWVQVIVPSVELMWFPKFIIENSANQIIVKEAWEQFPAVVKGGVVTWRPSFRLDLEYEYNRIILFFLLLSFIF